MLFFPPHGLLQQGLSLLPFPEGRRVAFNSIFRFNECKMNKTAGEPNLVSRAAAESTRCLSTVLGCDFLC